MSASGVGCEAVINYSCEIESFSLIAHDDGNSLAGRAAAADVNLLLRIFLIAMYDGVSESLAERQLDVERASRDALRSFDESHQAICRR